MFLRGVWLNLGFDSYETIRCLQYSDLLVSVIVFSRQIYFYHIVNIYCGKFTRSKFL